VERDWVKEGAFLSPVDFDSYLKPDVFAAASSLFTDDLAQQNYYKDIGYFKNVRAPDGDLGELVTGTKKGRTSETELTISLNLGLAIEDMATAVRVYRAAKAKGVGQLLPL
jgi:alanine dehydrogenase